MDKLPLDPPSALLHHSCLLSFSSHLLQNLLKQMSWKHTLFSGTYPYSQYEYGSTPQGAQVNITYETLPKGQLVNEHEVQRWLWVLPKAYSTEKTKISQILLHVPLPTPETHGALNTKNKRISILGLLSGIVLGGQTQSLREFQEWAIVGRWVCIRSWCTIKNAAFAQLYFLLSPLIFEIEKWFFSILYILY